MFSCEFCKISHNNFFKEPFGRLLLHKHSLCLLSYYDLSPFQKRCHTYFLAEYFFGLICRLGTKVSSICKTLSQKPIFNLFKHLGWSFSCEKVNSSTPIGISAKRAPLQMFNHILNAPLKGVATKRCSKVKNQNFRNVYHSQEFCTLTINFSEV